MQTGRQIFRVVFSLSFVTRPRRAADADVQAIAGVLRHEIPSGARAPRRKATMLPDCRIGGHVAEYELEDASTTG